MQYNAQELLNTAIQARHNAYAPYSRFLVGAALLGESGRIYTGCNVENAAYGVSNCGERTALFKAVSEGERHFTAIACVGGPEGADETRLPACTPCGVCRQALFEFGGNALPVILADGNGGYTVTPLGELLPAAFGPEDL